MVPDIALAASAREWPDRLHRFLLDHGGGRVVDRVMTADQASRTSFDVLLIDDVCSFLTPRLVSILKQSGAEVVGVYMPEDGSHAKRRLLECGISDVIETEASPEEFLEKIAAALAHRLAFPAPGPTTSSPALRVAVCGPCEGVGISEIAISLALALGRDLSTVLVDMDPVWPSVAQRLDLPPHPNIRTALDHALHRPDRLLEAMHRVDALMIVGGRADGGQGPDISRADAVMLVDSLAALADVVVVDLGPHRAGAPGLLGEFDTVILVGEGNPVGVARLVRTAGSVLTNNPAQSVLAAVNKTGKGSFRRSEIVAEIERSVPGMPTVTLPFEPGLEQAAWDGTMVSRGRYWRAVSSMAGVVVGSLS